MATCTYLVQTAGTTTTLCLHGCASYVNCGQLRDYLHELEKRPGKTDLLVDLRRCTAVDSTILGLLSGAALSLARKVPPCRVIFANIDGRVLEVVKNLGLHHVVEIAESPMPVSTDSATLLTPAMCETGLMLDAHTALIKAHPENENKFHDVVEALRAQL